MGYSIRVISFLLIVPAILYAPGGSASEGYYKWVPEEYSETWTVPRAAYSALDMTAYYNNTAYLTDRLIRTGLMAYALRDTLEIRVNTACQPTWDTHIGNGRFSVSDRELRATYGEAGTSIMTNIVEIYFKEIDRSRVMVYFAIHGIVVGVWCDGVMKLKGE